MNKIPIAEGQVRGNLNELTQEYYINYMPEEEGMCPKLEIAILLTRDGVEKEKYRSIRFTNSAQIKSFIIGLIKGYFLFGKHSRYINTANYKFRLNQLWKEILSAINGG